MRENKNGYVPHPIATSDVVITDEKLLQLAEMLAENTHEVWSVGKMAQGFVFGEETSNEAKTHTDLRPYAELPESGKDYDRNTSFETIKLLLKLGWTLVPPAE